MERQCFVPSLLEMHEGGGATLCKVRLKHKLMEAKHTTQSKTLYYAHMKEGAYVNEMQNVEKDNSTATLHMRIAKHKIHI